MCSTGILNVKQRLHLTARNWSDSARTAGQATPRVLIAAAGVV